MSFKKALFGLGGGSDFFSACVLAQDSDSMIVTALSPILTDQKINVEETINKYTGKLSIPNSTAIQKSKYDHFTVRESDNEWPILVDSRRVNSFGIIIPSRECVSERAACQALLISLMGPSPHIVAVDTGGDSLRGIVPGMGDRDLSYLYGGVDTRDADCIEILKNIPGRESFTLYVMGPGSDGETTGDALYNALHDLKQNLVKGVILKSVGKMKDFQRAMNRVDGWKQPVPGSTLDNIRRAMMVGDDELVEIIRVGKAIDSVKAKFLSSYWVMEITNSPT
jgi:hypothetical protein